MTVESDQHYGEMKSFHKILIKLFVSIIILYYLFLKIDTTEFLLSLSEIKIVYIVISFFLFYFSLLLTVFKWQLVLAPHIHAKTKDIFLIVWASNFINLFGLGAIGGETYKMLAFDNKKLALKTSLFDKFLSFYWFLLLGASFYISFFIFQEKPASNVFVFGIIFYCIAFAFNLLLNTYRKKLIKLIPFEKVYYYLNKINLNNGSLLLHSFISMLIVFNTAIIYSLVFFSMEIKNMIIQFIIFIPFLKMAVALPISFEGLGVREFLLVEFAKITSINVETALLCSFLVYFTGLAYRLTGIFAFLFFRNQ